MRTTLMLFAALVLLAACGESKPPERTVFDPQLQALKKAREAEGKLQEGAQKEREEIERSEGKSDQSGGY